MKKTLLALALTVGIAHTGSAFVAVTGADGETNAKGPGNSAPGAQVGDTFSVNDGNFVSYVPGPGDPTITDNDLGNYQYILNGTVTSVSGGVVDYTGTYEIYYDATASQSENEADYAYSSGTFTLDVNFNGVGPYLADGVLTQTSGPSPTFTSLGYDGFAEDTADFVGTYTQLSNPADGLVQGTISSVPDASSTVLLATPCLAGLAFLRRKVA